MRPLKVTTVGGSAGVILPKEALARLKVDKGDFIYLTEIPNGYQLTPYDPLFERQMDAMRRVMRRDRKVLRELAK